MQWFMDDQVDTAIEQSDLLPVLEEASEAVWEAVSSGQPVLLTHRGRPAVVVIDLETYTSWEEATGLAP